MPRPCGSVKDLEAADWRKRKQIVHSEQAVDVFGSCDGFSCGKDTGGLKKMSGQEDCAREKA